jgi:hypothetical protein
MTMTTTERTIARMIKFSRAAIASHRNQMKFGHACSGGVYTMLIGKIEDGLRHNFGVHGPAF